MYGGVLGLAAGRSGRCAETYGPVTGDTKTLIVERLLRFPPERVWRALTVPDPMAEWLRKGGFAPRVGQRVQPTSDTLTVARLVRPVAAGAGPGAYTQRPRPTNTNRVKRHQPGRSKKKRVRIQSELDKTKKKLRGQENKKVTMVKETQQSQSSGIDLSFVQQRFEDMGETLIDSIEGVFRGSVNELANLVKGSLSEESFQVDLDSLASREESTQILAEKLEESFR